MVFKKLLGALGVGGPSVDTVLSDPSVLPGGRLRGHVNLRGGDHDVEIEQVTVALTARVEAEHGGGEYHGVVEFYRHPVNGRFRLAAGAALSMPFEFDLPWETPITHVGGQRLLGMAVGLHTELAVARAADKSDLDPVTVHPLPAHERILRAVDGLGFRFKSADLEQGHIRGIDQRLPFYQEIEFWAAPQYAHAFNALEVTFVTNPAGIDVILEVDKRGGHDAYHHLRAAHADAQTDWARVIDGWLQQEVLSRASHRLGGHGFAGHHGHSGHHRHGVGTGAIVGGVAAGLVGGYVAGEVMDEVFDDGGFFEE